MFIYNKLFYCAYRLAEKSRNFNDIEYISGSGVVSMCIYLNFASITFIIKGLGISSEIDFFIEKYQIFIAISLFISVLLYYRCGKRYIRIVDYYKKRKIKTNNWLYMLSWEIISGICVFIAAAFYRREWIFESIPPIDLF